MTILVSILVPLIVFSFSTYFRNPGWAESLAVSTENKWTWKKLNIYSAVFSAFFSLLVGILTVYFTELNNISSISIITATATISYVLFQSYVTDMKIRLSDRGTLRIASLLAIAVGLVYYLYTDTTNYEMYFWIGGLIWASLLLFFPGFGSSDARAIMLVIAAAFPIVGVLGIVFSFAIYVLIALVFIYYVVVKYRVSSLAYVNHISIPAVPLVLFPFFILMIYVPLNLIFGLGWLESLFGWVEFWN